MAIPVSANCRGNLARGRLSVGAGVEPGHPEISALGCGGTGYVWTQSFISAYSKAIDDYTAADSKIRPFSRERISLPLSATCHSPSQAS